MDFSLLRKRDAPSGRDSPGRIFGVLSLVLGLAALASVIVPMRTTHLMLGALFFGFGLMQNIAGFASGDSEENRSWFSRGGSSILTGLLLMLAPKMTFAGLALVLGASWALSGLTLAARSFWRQDHPDWIWSAIDGFVGVALGVAVAAQWPVGGMVSAMLFIGLRYLSEGWSILIGRATEPERCPEANPDAHPDPGLGLDPHPEIGRMRRRLEEEETLRGKTDRRWVLLFLFTFLVIHAARMNADWNLIGMVGPLGAVGGDALLAMAIAYGLVAPISAAWRRLTRESERQCWRRTLSLHERGLPGGVLSALRQSWLARRMRSTLRRNQARTSATAAAGWGLRTGLPAAAIIMAMTPLWGVSWFFDTETWVTGGWELWSEHRTDDWRVEMVRAVGLVCGGRTDDPDFLRVRPEGLESNADFAFIVIGDTGEGDASQHILRDQLLMVARKPELKFVVVSSDVIYPSGAMKDYEPKFYLPFKGIHRPIYAVPGNHDWYDALESFTANFFEPQAARAAMRARREMDLRLTTTTEARIEGMISEAKRLRDEYQIQAAAQRAPYFDLQTDQFALIVVDTGILRQIDDDQKRWLQNALERAGERFKMVILGHPLYAGGRYQGADDEAFADLHQLLRKHRVAVVMAGDTHDFEYYREESGNSADSPGILHFVNGGGGAYLSIGTAFGWPKVPPVRECGFYPRLDALTESLERHTPAWKWPLWLWVKQLNAWPSSPETLAAAFSYDRAPFFQSFMEVRVEPATGVVRFLLYGHNGRLRWRDLQLSAGRPPAGDLEDFVEFRLPLKQETPVRGADGGKTVFGDQNSRIGAER